MTQATKTWVLTGGINKGLTKYIGEALRETATGVCMGITPWISITNRLNLIGDRRIKYDIPKTFNMKDKYLDNNHTHFFLVDNNYAENHNTIIDFSTSLVTMLRKLQYEGMNFLVCFKIFSKKFSMIQISGLFVHAIFSSNI